MSDNSTGLSLSNKEDAIIYFAATNPGFSAVQISELVGCDAQYVRDVFKEERFQFQVKHLRYKLYGKDVQKKFRDLLPQALEALEDVITNPNHKAQLRFNAAQEIFDRSLGKPKQTVQHEGSLLQEIYEKLDNKKTTTIDVSPESTDNPNGAYPIEETPDVRDNIDSWIKESF